LWSKTRASHHGEFVQFEECISMPHPVHGSVPIVVGGHTDAAARRAGTRGDGFYPGAATADEIARLVRVMHEAATLNHRDGDAIPVYAMAIGKPGDALYRRIEELAGIGVAQVILPAFRPDTLAEIGPELTSRFG
jgi:alkanesulfonate monooxygenase SsuD/methylene tetrahydromethanopterin reductase-like flavin-dependent oxidoreductase (luciferase family)